MQVIAGNRLVNLVEVTAVPDGSLSYWRSFKFPLKDHHGESLLAGFSQEVTADVHREAELTKALQGKTSLAVELEAAQQLFREYANRSPNATYIKTEDGRYVFYNRVFAKLFGISETEWIGKYFYDVLPADIAARFTANYTELLKGSTDVQTTEYLPNAEGEMRIFRMMRYTYTDSAGARMIGGVAVDVTQEKTAEAALRKSHDEKDLLLREVHHRMKNNLSVISSLLYLQAEDAGNADLSTLLGEGQSRIRSMALVHEALSRSDHLGEIDFGSYAGLLADRLFSSHSLRDTSVSLTKSLQTVLLPIDRALPCGLILNEMLLNALKHAFPKGCRGSVRVFVSADPPGFATIGVSDDGVGVPRTQESSSMGLHLIQALTQQVKGTFNMSPAQPGTCTSVTLEV